MLDNIKKYDFLATKYTDILKFIIIFDLNICQKIGNVHEYFRANFADDFYINDDKERNKFYCLIRDMHVFSCNTNFKLTLEKSDTIENIKSFINDMEMTIEYYKSDFIELMKHNEGLAHRELGIDVEKFSQEVISAEIIMSWDGCFLYDYFEGYIADIPCDDLIGCAFALKKYLLTSTWAYHGKSINMLRKHLLSSKYLSDIISSFIDKNFDSDDHGALLWTDLIQVCKLCLFFQSSDFEKIAEERGVETDPVLLLEITHAWLYIKLIFEIAIYHIEIINLVQREYNLEIIRLSFLICVNMIDTHFFTLLSHSFSVNDSFEFLIKAIHKNFRRMLHISAFTPSNMKDYHKVQSAISRTVGHLFKYEEYDPIIDKICNEIDRLWSSDLPEDHKYKNLYHNDMKLIFMKKQEYKEFFEKEDTYRGFDRRFQIKLIEVAQKHGKVRGIKNDS